MFLFSVLLFSQCTDDNGDDNAQKGLVSFKTEPVYSSGTISFAAQVQFGFVGKATNCEYQLLDGSTVITSGTANCNSNIDGMGLFWNSAGIQLNINQAIYTGKTLTVFLDPSNKITDDLYTTTSYVNLYKKAEVLIP